MQYVDTDHVLPPSSLPAAYVLKFFWYCLLYVLFLHFYAL